MHNTQCVIEFKKIINQENRPWVCTETVLVPSLPRVVPRVLNLCPGGRLTAPFGFSSVRPRGFSVEGLAEDVAEGLPEKNSKGAFNLPLGHRLRTLGTALGHRFTWLPPRLFHGLSFCLNSARVDWKLFLTIITLGRSVVNLCSSKHQHWQS